MTRRPPQPLDAEERALAALLPRPHGRAEPGADLDARILAAAQAALQAQPPVRRPRRSWIGPTALAASLVLAVGMAWQLRPPPALPAPAAAEDAASADVVSMRAIESPPPSPMTQVKPMAVPPPQAIVSAPPAQDAPDGFSAPTVAPAAAPPPAPAPQAPPAAAVAAEADEAIGLTQAPEPARAQAPAMAKATASEAMRERTAASGTIAAENREEAQRAADAATLDTVMVADPEEDIPPATADSPEVRDAWLRRIGELLEQGRTVEAKASLAEFRRRYPDAALPPELRKLEP
jgi:outer membrane biosynthesis protein TonB